MRGWIGISLGDVTGIGPEVTLKALQRQTQHDNWRYLILGDLERLQQLNQALNLGLALQPYREGSPDGQIFVHNPFPEALPSDLLPGSPLAAGAAIAYLKDGAERCLRHELDALVTAPVNKEAIIRAGYSFIGQTEFLSHLAGTEQTAMMLLGADDRGRWLRVALATTHVPLRFVADQLRQSKIELVIELAAKACQDLGLTQARVGVCGLNPHAGEGGEIGTEEITIISPAVRAAQERQINVAGPLAADTLFYWAYKGEFDAVVAMYHDQGLGPLKMIGFEHGVNWTLGLPFIRTSPDHGTAYDIAGKGKANSSSMEAALSLAKQLVKSKEASAR